MRLPGRIIASPNRVAAALAIVTIIFPTVYVDAASNNPRVKCSTTCVTQNCKNAGIRYGKYCGVGWSGCPGEKPCDDLDACCQIHDECVDNKGYDNVQCHEEFKTCIKKLQNSGKVGFSKDCSYEEAIPTMIKGMDLAIILSHITSSSKVEL